MIGYRGFLLGLVPYSVFARIYRICSRFPGSASASASGTHSKQERSFLPGASWHAICTTLPGPPILTRRHGHMNKRMFRFRLPSVAGSLLLAATSLFFLDTSARSQSTAPQDRPDQTDATRSERG